jgi:hypothetical protein
MFWGEHNGMVEIKKIEEIAAALPVAASLIEDLHLSACYSGNERYLVRWRRVFPNVSTIWAYSGSAPGAHSGAQKHLSIWNSATKGNKIKLDRSIASNTRKGKNVAVAKPSPYRSDRRLKTVWRRKAPIPNGR